MPKIRRFLIGLLFAALFMIVWTALEIYLPASSLKSYLQTAAGIVFTIAGLYFMFRRTRDSQSRAVEAKIESLKKAGQPLAVETEEPFNGNDRNVFSRRQNSLILSAVILVIIATAMGGFVVYVFADPANHFLTR